MRLVMSLMSELITLCRARNIKNKPFINRVEEPLLHERDDDELERLKAELGR